jgi:hypothetical protein
LVATHLRDWGRRPGAQWCLVLAGVVTVLAASGVESHDAGLFRAVLGGPTVVVVGHQLEEGPPWTWLIAVLLFGVAALTLVETDDAWTALALVRGVSRRRWAVTRLAALAVGACGYLAALVALLALVAGTGWRPGPIFQPPTLWDIVAWALALISLGWCAMALALATRGPWTSWVVMVLLLGVAGFGGNMAPYVPVAQSIVALHGWPGTPSVGEGLLCLAAWTVVSGLAVLGAANRVVPT